MFSESPFLYFAIPTSTLKDGESTISLGEFVG